MFDDLAKNWSIEITSPINQLKCLDFVFNLFSIFIIFFACIFKELKPQELHIMDDENYS